MYLKALEIQGFKSFPDKTRLEFNRDVTAIVGPNGSGKSNISDALRWVMGEQSSKSLRGAKMEDVIFGGTEKRSAVGFAQVSLTIDNSMHILNSDSPEVTVTRRYYRSGESEYYINREAVRLRDINETLMDTGLGRDGYSIIGQGRIDEILSAKSTDRRDVFEEAAGISKYRYRKEEAERKLSRTGENLIRVNDKIDELELQVGPLRKQSETARKYLILRDELRDLEISVWCAQLDKIRIRTLTTAQEYERVKNQLESYKERLEGLYKDAEILTERMHSCDIEAEECRSLLSENDLIIADLDSSCAVLEANIEALEKTIENINDEIAAQESRTQSLLLQINEHKEKIATIDKRKEELSERFSKIITEAADVTASSGETEKNISQLLRMEAEENAKAADCRTGSAAASASALEIKKRISDSEEELKLLEEKAEEAVKNVSALKKSLSQAEEDELSAKNSLNGFNMRLENRKKALDAVQAEKTQLTIHRGSVNSRFSMLRDMEKEYQGYSNAVRSIMKAKADKALRGIHGPVANLVRTDDKYSLAIETALGGAAQNIVVTNDADGKAAINFLKRKDAGRATFSPISTIKGNPLKEQGLEDEDGFEGIALNLVTFDEQYAGIYANIIGRVVVAEDLDSAVRIGRKYSNRFKIVTLDGQVVNAGGSMTGGSVSKKIGILSRANEIEKLQAEIAELDKQAKQFEEKESEALRQYEAAKADSDKAEASLRKAQDSVLALKTEIIHAKQIESAAQNSVELMKGELAAVRERLLEYDSKTAELEKATEQHCAAAQEYRQQADEILLGQDKLKKRSDELASELSDMRAESAALETGRSASEASVSDLTAMWEELKQSSAQRADKISEVREHTKEAAEKLRQQKALREIHAEKSNQLREQISQLTAKRLEIEGERVKREKESQEKNRELLELQQDCSRLEQAKISAEFEEKQIVDKLWDSYELSPTAANELRTEPESLPKAVKRISELKRSITALGPPNIAAIDEFERVNERYMFLSGQRDDIEKAKRELEQIIADITAEMKEIFAREFAVISSSFSQTFLELFGGGRAELILEDESDILNCGIEIKVQPPGKALKTLTLLSGGERAFVAIAIYFAILKVRPTPFCVMDEIESALDEANVLRFSDYLRSVSEKTQFLLITHRRGTMEGADELFGVTMQQGVSKVINIDLAEAEKSISN